MEFAKLSYEIDKLQDVVEERNRLVDVLQIKPSNKDTISIKRQLNTILSLLNDTPDLSQAEKFNDIVSRISGDDESFTEASKKLYLYDISSIPQNNTNNSITTTVLEPPVKKVRFTEENDIHENYVNSVQIEPVHNNTNKVIDFAPYKDSFMQPDSSSIYSMMSSTNEELLANQHDTIRDQDDVLDSLSTTIHRTHDMSINIRDEVDYQNDGLLGDLENMMDSTTNTLNIAHTKLARFAKMNRDSGGSLCRAALIMGLIVLLFVITFLL